jgi:diguanylate cyclase (GGDEF)-like protein
MNQNYFYLYMQKQIILLMLIGLVQGAIYVFICWMNDIFFMALAWYCVVNFICLWGWNIYMKLDISNMTFDDLNSWYNKVRYFMYVMFSMWSIIFVVNVQEVENNVHYIALFFQFFMAIIVTTFLGSDKKLFAPTLIILMLPLVIYFYLLGVWYGYFLAMATLLLLGILLYASNKSYTLIRQIYYEAQIDNLTGLYNRRFFLVHLDRLINTLQRDKEYGYILLIDLDYFKTINDSLGHKVGDKLLVQVGERITKMCEGTHVCARLGGDEFIVVGEEYDTRDIAIKNAYAFAEKLRKNLKKTYHVEQHQIYLSASIGISVIGHLNLNASDLVKEADIAMSAVKHTERDGIVLFDNHLKIKIDKKLEMERKLRFSIQKNEIYLNYQPQFNEYKKIVGVEVLARWKNPMLGNVSPVEFIEVAEKIGFIVELGTYILEESFKTFKKWDNTGIDLEHFSINISVKQFLHPNFLDDVNKLCQRYLTESSRNKIIFEVTETLFSEDTDKIIMRMHALKEWGISFSMDDFGTGYSSLSNLKNLPVDELKIDQVFVSQIGKDFTDEMMLVLILSMKTVFDVNIVAEGIETKEQYTFLAENGCQIFQGYYFSKPLNEEAFKTLYLSQI